ncbi:MAG: hypothetical protein M1426_01435 [Patescibacteria group bacterium]|nr:hypothetical protein [Patescibacteria group bacterium]
MNNKLLAQIISWVFNPLLILIPVPYILVLKTTNNYNLAYFWSIFSFVFILIIFIFILVGIEKKYFSDFDISKRKERPLLFTFSIALSALYTVLLYFMHAPQVLFVGIFALILGLITIEIVNRVTKASVHVGTIAAFATSLSLAYSGIFYLTFLLIPLVAWSRIKTHNHTKRQTIIGAALGVLTTIVVYVIFKYIV